MNKAPPPAIQGEHRCRDRLSERGDARGSRAAPTVAQKHPRGHRHQRGGRSGRGRAGERRTSGSCKCGGGGGAGGMPGSQSRTPPGTHLHGWMFGTSSKAVSRHRQSGKDCPAVQPRLQRHRGYDLPGNPTPRQRHRCSASSIHACVVL